MLTNLALQATWWTCVGLLCCTVALSLVNAYCFFRNERFYRALTRREQALIQAQRGFRSDIEALDTAASLNLN